MVNERTLFVDTFFGKDVFSREKRGDEVRGKTRVWPERLYFLLSDANWSAVLLGFWTFEHMNESKFSDTD